MALAERVLGGGPSSRRSGALSCREGGSATRAEALAVLMAPAEELLALLEAAFAVRRHYFGLGVSLHVIRNAKSGLCTEDCAYCSQSAKSAAAAPRYELQPVEEILQGALEAQALKAVRYCIVTSSRAPQEEELNTVCAAAEQIKRATSLQVCTSLGLVDAAQARRLKLAGVDRFNHNLETSERFYPSICQTHSYSDRLATARAVKAAGVELCCGALMGLGETPEDRVDLAFALREVEADSIPVNFLDPRPGTAFEHRPRLAAAEALRILVMFRLVNPSRELRVAGGREVCLGPLQALALYPANSIFTNGYLTTPGQGHAADLAMIEAAGFQVTDVTQA
ncbi:MAG: biotin synthase BioB [Lentisphaerae bacterium]|nr:biotin synthase BioB [Lentisphaerota bacterium]